MSTSSVTSPPPLPGERLERQVNERYAFRWFFAGGFVTGVVVAALTAWLIRLQSFDWTAEVLTVVGVIGIAGMALLYKRTGIGIRPLLIGARKEREIANVLDDLRSRGYSVFHQVPIPRTPHPDFSSNDDPDEPYAADSWCRCAFVHRT